MNLLTFAQYDRRRPRWISVKEALPADNIVFVFFIGGNYVLTAGVFWRRADHPPMFYVQGGQNFFPCEWVEYWMPAANDPRHVAKKGA